jgi:hypothetical protein
MARFYDSERTLQGIALSSFGVDPRLAIGRLPIGNLPGHTEAAGNGKCFRRL